MESTGTPIINYRASTLTHIYTHLNHCKHVSVPNYFLPFNTPLWTCDEWMIWKMDNCQTAPFRNCSHEFRAQDEGFICFPQCLKSCFFQETAILWQASHYSRSDDKLRNGAIFRWLPKLDLKMLDKRMKQMEGKVFFSNVKYCFNKTKKLGLGLSVQLKLIGKPVPDFMAIQPIVVYILTLKTSYVMRKSLGVTKALLDQ